jgi:predicted small lipoprotein YifL
MVKIHNSVLSGLVLSAMLATTIALAGCGAKGADAPTPETPPKVETPAPAAPAALDVSAVLQKVSGSEDLFSWHTAREAYLAGTARDAEVDTALSAKEAELRTKTPGWPVNDALEILAFDWKFDGGESSEGKPANFTAKWLFHAKQDIQLPADVAVKLVLRGWPDKAHRHYLTEAGRKEDRYFETTYDFTPPLGEWKAGNYYLVERRVKASLPNVPYRIHTVYSQVKKKEDGTSGGYAGPYAALTDLGWFADLGR